MTFQNLFYVGDDGDDHPQDEGPFSSIGRAFYKAYTPQSSRWYYKLNNIFN